MLMKLMQQTTIKQNHYRKLLLEELSQNFTLYGEDWVNMVSML